MSKVIIFGATGFTGGNIARELVSRGHEVIGVARNIDGKEIAGVTLVAGSLTDEAFVREVIAGASDVVLAVHHINPDLAAMVPSLLAATSAAGARLSVVGGAGCLLVAPGGPKLFDTAEFPPEFKTEAFAAGDTLDALMAAQHGEWFYVSPAAMYGAFAPGERTGKYRNADDVLITDESGNSSISGEDFAIAYVDEIEQKKHRNKRFTVGY